MITIQFETDGAAEKFRVMDARLEGLPSEMREEMANWLASDVDRPDIQASQTTSKSIEARVGRRIRRRLIRRLMPQYLRVIRRYARIGRRPIAKTLPTPIRRVRMLQRQAAAIQRGRPRAIGRALRPLGMFYRLQRRATIRGEFATTFVERMRQLAGTSISWR